MAGLAPQTLRQQPDPDSPLPEGISVEVQPDDAPDQEITNDKGNVVQIRHGDGTVTVSLDGRPLTEILSNDDEPKDWFENLAERIDASVLSSIAQDLIRGVNEDLQSRQEWVEARTTGVKLLGLEIEVPSLQGGSDGAPLEGMSKVRHPLLLEAVLRFQANARSELLPTDGPVKVRNDTPAHIPGGVPSPQDQASDADNDTLSNALETDLNHYLTDVATEYYPDTDRMLFMTGFGGAGFKKVYFCPLRSRPVSEGVDANDLIVNQSATDLGNAKRVTHRIMMRPSTVKRMQILKAYRDIDLGQAMAPKLDSLKLQEKAQQGVNPSAATPLDYDREIYECYCELNIAGFEHQHKGKDSGLEIPYRVTIDVSSQEVLSVVRNYDEATKDLPKARQCFVKYSYVPGFGFYPIGLLHILGNTTNAITAAWRELLDAGMYANFPGFLVAKNGTRQSTNNFRVPPGGGAQVDVGGQSLRDAIMPLPYKEPSQALMLLVKDISETGQRVGGTSELQVGEGNGEMPVGTALAMIEQATKIENAVHKRLHAAQALEFKMLVECFRENPESFWQRGCKSNTQWNKQTFLAAINACELVPQADPNTASHGQRVMKIMGLKQLQSASPELYNKRNVDIAALRALGWNNPDQFMVSADQANQPSPEVQKGIAELEIKKTTADADMISAQAKQAESNAKVQGLGAFAPKQPNAPAGGVAPQVDTPVDKELADTKRFEAQTKRIELTVDQQAAEADIEARHADQESREKIQVMELARDIIRDKSDAAIAIKQAKTADRALTIKKREAAKPKPKAPKA